MNVMFFVTNVIFGLVWLVTHILLMFGTLKKSHNFLRPYLYTAPILFALVSIGFVGLLIRDFLNRSNMADLPMYSLLSAVVLGITVCSYGVVLSHFKELHDIANQDALEPRRPYPYRVVEPRNRG